MTETIKLRYRAFISYAHADVSWSKWLHRQLEHFRIDKDVVGRSTLQGPVPSSLRPIFRDREDFAGGHSLNNATVVALDASAALIVLCSPIAATRPAVNEEVRLFRWRHPQRPVIPVILDGAYPESFPPALRCEVTADGDVTERPVAILGADLRETGDGRSLGLAKIVAGLTGIGTDEIVRRATREQRRRVRNWLIGLSAIAVVLSGLSAWAEINRRDAVTKKQIAEDEKRSADEMFASAAGLLTILSKQLVERENPILPAAHAIYERGARRGNAIAMVNLAIFYDYGRGVPQDYAKAQEWYQNAWNLGNPDGLNGLAELLAHGKGTPPDPALARKLYEQAAAAGSARAMTNLGQMLMEGAGIEPNYQLGLAWLEKAIEKGDPVAPRVLGDLFMIGRGVKRDEFKAQDLYRVAAKRGNPGAVHLAFERQLIETMQKRAKIAGDSPRGPAFVKDAMLKSRAKAGDPEAMRALADAKSHFGASHSELQEAKGLYEKAAAGGDRLADERLKDLSVLQAIEATRYVEAREKQEARLKEIEFAEMQARGKAGSATAIALARLAFCYILTDNNKEALEAAERAALLSPLDPFVQLQHAHALAFNGRIEEASAIHSAHRGRRLGDVGLMTWEQHFLRQLDIFKKAGRVPPDLERLLQMLDQGKKP